MRLAAVTRPACASARSLVAIGLLLLATTATEAGAQQGERREASMSREALTGLRDDAARKGDTDAAERLSFRLREGDFMAGDRIVVSIIAAETRSDTLAVRTDRTVRLEGLTEVSLAGVLRSELRPVLDSAVSRYLRNAKVEAYSLMRVAVMGEVLRPGFYAFTSDVLLGDVVMAAGGPTSDADLSKVDIRRNGDPLFDPKVGRQFIDNGFTLDDAGIRPGDSVTIGRRRHVSQSAVLSWITAIGGIIALTATIAR